MRLNLPVYRGTLRCAGSQERPGKVYCYVTDCVICILIVSVALSSQAVKRAVLPGTHALRENAQII